MLSSGTPLAPIVIWGDDGTIWPLVHADSIATITHGDARYFWSGDDYWIVHRMKFRAMDDGYGAISASKTSMLIDNCQFVEFTGATDPGIYLQLGARLTMRACVFHGNVIGEDGTNTGTGVTNIGGYHELWRCTFDDMTNALLSSYATHTYAYECDVGVNQANTNDALSNAGWIVFLGGSIPNASYDNTVNYWHGGTRVYGLDGSKRVTWLEDAEVQMLQTDYTTLHSGGGAYSLAAAFAANENTGPTSPWYLAEYAVYADSAETRTYTMYAYRDAAWTPLPSATELRLEVIAWDADSLKITSSTETLVDSLAWYSLSAEVTPNHNGTVFVRLVCEDYDADGVLYVDPKLTATGETYHEMFAPLGPDLAFFYTAPAGDYQYGRIIIVN